MIVKIPIKIKTIETKDTKKLLDEITTYLKEADINKERRKEKLIKYLTHKELNITESRMLVFEEIHNASSISEIDKNLKEKRMFTSINTIKDALKLFAKAEIIKQSKFTSKSLIELV